MEVAFGTLRLSIAPTVYEPAEDSFMLATYASGLAGEETRGGKTGEGKTASSSGLRILEMGCGSGIVSLSAAKASSRNEVLGVDINPVAVECAKGNAKRNGLGNCEFEESDLFSAIAASSQFDIILFNPPYLPTTREERLSLENENAAYDGGESGLETFMRFSQEAPSHLVPGGKVAVIATSLGDGVKKTIAELEARVGQAQILAEESFFFEKIALIGAAKR